MPRPLAAVTLCAVSFAVTAPAAPTLKPAIQLYYPTTVGTTMVHTDGTLEMRLTVTRVLEREGVKYVIVRDVTSPKPQWISEVVAVSEKGVFQVQVMDRRIDPPIPFLKLPCNKVSRWELGDT